MGNSKNANATVAITAVQIAKRICIESKKKNMIIKDIEAPVEENIEFTQTIYLDLAKLICEIKKLRLRFLYRNCSSLASLCNSM